MSNILSWLCWRLAFVHAKVVGILSRTIWRSMDGDPRNGNWWYAAAVLLEWNSKERWNARQPNKLYCCRFTEVP